MSRINIDAYYHISHPTYISQTVEYNGNRVTMYLVKSTFRLVTINLIFKTYYVK